MSNKVIRKAGKNWWDLIEEIIKDTNNKSFTVPPYKRKMTRNELLLEGDYSKLPSTKRKIDFVDSLPKKFGNDSYNRSMGFLNRHEPSGKIKENLSRLDQYYTDKELYGFPVNEKGKRIRSWQIMDSPNGSRYNFLPEEVPIAIRDMDNYNARPSFSDVSRWYSQRDNVNQKIRRAAATAYNVKSRKEQLETLGAIAGTITAANLLSQSALPSKNNSSGGALRVSKKIKKSQKYFER